MTGFQNAQLYSYNAESISVQKGYVPDETKKFYSKDRISWLNFHQALTTEELNQLSSCLDLHPATKEDIKYTQKRPKVEEFEDYLFFSITSALPNVGKQLKTEQIDFILSESFLISFQETKSGHFDEIRDRLTQNKGVLRQKKSDYLLFRLLECITDNYYEVLDGIVSEIEVLDKETYKSPRQEVLNKIEELKRKLIYLKRIMSPMKDIVGVLASGHDRYLDRQNAHYFKNLKDNCAGIIEEIETNKQILDGLNQLYYSALSHKMNEIMKLLTIVGVIFMPLTFIVGVYGMNFDYMPELHWKYSYFASLFFMMGLVAWMIFYFKRRKWL